MHRHLRIARPVKDIERATSAYIEGLGLTILASFEDHEGFDGVMVGNAEADYHFEFTHCRHHPIDPQPTEEDLIVFYVPDHDQWKADCDRMIGAGFQLVKSFNPYWDQRGQTFVDDDGYRIVLQNAAW